MDGAERMSYSDESVILRYGNGSDWASLLRCSGARKDQLRAVGSPRRDSPMASVPQTQRRFCPKSNTIAHPLLVPTATTPLTAITVGTPSRPA